jgi:hypothetical protein
MVSSSARTVPEYLESLSSERATVISAVRGVILEHLPPGYQEAMNWGMVSYQVPLEFSGPTYNNQPLLYAALAAQKNHYSLYLMGIYASPERASEFSEAYRATGKRLDVGKACVRFRTLDDLPLDLVGHAIGHTSCEDFVEIYRQSRSPGAT